jgi:hypothetical protein
VQSISSDNGALWQRTHDRLIAIYQNQVSIYSGHSKLHRQLSCLQDIQSLNPARADRDHRPCTRSFNDVIEQSLALLR